MGRRKKYKINYYKFISRVTILVIFIILIIFGISEMIKGGNDIEIYGNNEKCTSIVGKEETLKEPEEYTLKIAAGGDLLIHDTVFKSAQSSDRYI